MNETAATKLAEPLDRARVKSRTDGRGGSLSYLETHDVIRAANTIFGFGQWGHEVVELRHINEVVVHNKDKKPGVSVGYVCIVRLTVEGCVPVSGVGFGDATEYRESGPVTAHELAAKEAESDALKRALKNYGDQFGLALYDKDAARSTHITSDKPKPKPAAKPPAADPVIGGLHVRILELAQQLEADPVTVQKSISDNLAANPAAAHIAWCERQVRTMEGSVAQKIGDAKFQIPAGAGA